MVIAQTGFTAGEVSTKLVFVIRQSNNTNTIYQIDYGVQNTNVLTKTVNMDSR